jgi:Flp pilus assembly pilin Flp
VLGDQEGAVIVEYAVLFSIFSIAAIAGLEFIAGSGFTALSYLGTELQNYGLRNGQ